MKINNRLNILLVILTAAVITAAVCYLFYTYPAEISQSGEANEIEQLNRVQQKDYVKLLFVGDLMFDRGIRYYSEKNGGNDFIFSAQGGPASSWETLSDFLKSNDLVIANLEGPITDNKSISAGTKPGSTNNYYFTFDPSLAKTLFEKNIRLVNLGNNHILNFGKNGLESTRNYLNENNIDYFGAPGYPKGILIEIGGIKISFVSYNEFSNLPKEIEEKSTIDEIQKFKEYSDIIIIYSHWGYEYMLKNNKAQENLAYKFIDAGADLIIGSHPHVIQNMEIYNSKRIYYSLGNFIFDQYFDENVRNGLGVIVKIDKNTKQLDFSEEYFYLDSNGQTVPLY